MGAYLSEPVTEKVSSDEFNDKLECGASSMQGWRVNQEDAHNTILEFDVNTSLFAVYDGHGGAEVATYCAQKLPDSIKNTEAYKSGDIVKALEDAFLGFDASIATKEVMDILKELAGDTNPAPGECNDDSEDENVSNLYKEARLPLQEVLATYENKLSAMHRARLGDKATPLSPCLRAKKNETEEAAGSSGGASSSSSSCPASAAAGSSSEPEPADDTGGVSSTNSNDCKDTNGEVSTSEPSSGASSHMATAAPDSSADTCPQPQSSENKVSANADLSNGEVTESKPDAEEGITSSNGSLTPTKGKAKDKSPVSSSEKITPERPKKTKLRRAAAAAVYESLLKQASVEDEDDSDSNDETFEGEAHSSEEEQVNGVDGEDSSNDEEEDEEEESSDENDDDDNIMVGEEPGKDSGCTAVVALLKVNELYVANAGDSRCIMCRDGKAIDMSIDHKPEDALELDRITKAGGKVSSDGRINGGLNLSRAIGDHSYKENKDLDAKQQMITALPDVKTLTVDLEKDQFMVLACDGIWNFMSSQDVCDFILPRLAEGREKLSQICEEMFDHCLAPSTMGDGTGCDNMTAIIVRFRGTGAAPQAGGAARKRSADAPEPAAAQDPKRHKTDDTLSSSVVTSSV